MIDEPQRKKMVSGWNRGIHGNPEEKWIFSSWIAEKISGIDFHPLFSYHQKLIETLSKDPKQLAPPRRIREKILWAYSGIYCKYKYCSFNEENHTKENRACQIASHRPRMTWDDYLKSAHWQQACPRWLCCRDLGKNQSWRVTDLPKWYDGVCTNDTKIAACKKGDLKVLIEPWEFEVFFFLVEILAVFILLFGQSWIHTAGAIPFSLHQKVKFILGNRFISFMLEEDLTVFSSSIVPFINAQQIDHASRYHSLKFVSVNYIPKRRQFNNLSCQEQSSWLAHISWIANTNRRVV